MRFARAPRVTEREDGACSEDEAHRAEGAELVRVDEDAALLDAERIPGASEDVAIRADIFPDAFIAPIAVANEVGGDRDEIAITRNDAHVRDQPPRARLGKLGMAVGIEHPDDALADPLAVIGYEEKCGAVVAFELIVGRNV